MWKFLPPLLPWAAEKTGGKIAGPTVKTLILQAMQTAVSDPMAMVSSAAVLIYREKSGNGRMLRYQ